MRKISNRGEGIFSTNGKKGEKGFGKKRKIITVKAGGGWGGAGGGHFPRRLRTTCRR